MDIFGQYFNESYPEPSFNVRDLDTLDALTFPRLRDLVSRENAHDLIIGHVLGIDHAGHSFGSDNSQIERKILETEE